MTEEQLLEKKKLSPAHIQSCIVSVDYHSFTGSTVTVCLLTLKNGAKVVGTNYGSIDPDQQDWEMGRQEAYNAAFDQIWQLEGYLLRQKIHEASS